MAEKIRSRCWVMVLYPEDPSHAHCMEILASGGYKFAAILHNQDLWSEGESDNHVAGELKKEHWHVVLRFDNPRWQEAVAGELGIKPNYLEVCRNRDSALLYLVHDGFPDKHQYDISEVFGPLVPNLQKLLATDDEGERVKAIINMIDDIPGPVSYKSLLLQVCDNGLYGVFRRLGNGVGFLITEHNQEVAEYCSSPDEFQDMIKWHQRLKKAGDID